MTLLARVIDNLLIFNDGSGMWLPRGVRCTRVQSGWKIVYAMPGASYETDCFGFVVKTRDAIREQVRLCLDGIKIEASKRWASERGLGWSPDSYRQATEELWGEGDS